MKIITKMINTLVAIFLIINIVGLFLVNVHFAGLHFVKSATNELTPLINNNDLVLYQKQDNYQENDIIIYNIENKYSIAKVKSCSEYLTYIKDNTDNEYNPISNADIRGKAIKIFSAQSVIMYYSIVIICLIYLTVLIILNLNALKKNS